MSAMRKYLGRGEGLFLGMFTLAWVGYFALFFASERSFDGVWTAVRAGRFASLPGALYHDAGLMGMLGGALVLGLAIGCSWLVVKRYPGSLVLTGAAAAICVILLMSPLHPATEFRAFPFICLSFVVVGGLNQLMLRLRSGSG